MFLFHSTFALAWLLTGTEHSPQIGVYMSSRDYREGVDFQGLMKMGVAEYIFSANKVLSNGSIQFDSHLAASVEAFRKHAARPYTVSIGIDPSEFLKSTTSSIDEFKRQAQILVDDYKVNRILFHILYWTYPQGGQADEQWTKLMDMIDATRSLHGEGASSVTGSFMFTAENFTSRRGVSLWAGIDTYKPWLHADLVYVLLYARDNDPEYEISTDWAKAVIDHYSASSQQTSGLSLAVEPFGRAKGSSARASYAELIDRGAPPKGAGFYDGLYYNSQKQIQNKLSLVKDRVLHGMTLLYPQFDLPPGNSSSLLAAMQGA